ncbi:DoxX family protein [Salinibacterium sp. SWN1162]|uniref:DoxX family protein n=1 Tax=Salinibacterium sp. SWN1162 TaxID=2792053 RepID=UPI0018CEC7F9|nr:DoxX family protein [Salinibacterium sp. SWN1162]MBH0007815.1 DoxX family protein [Salinibacterium sp. SWN1162]
MIIAVWIASALLALAYLAAGGQKVRIAKDEAFVTFPWAERGGLGMLRAIGAVEILGALGLILPVLIGTLPILTPIAAVGLVLVQVVAVALHVRRGEFKTLPVNAVLLLLALFVAIARFSGV